MLFSVQNITILYKRWNTYNRYVDILEIGLTHILKYLFELKRKNFMTHYGTLIAKNLDIGNV